MQEEEAREGGLTGAAPPAAEATASQIASQLYCEYRVHLEASRRARRSRPAPDPAEAIVARVLGVERRVYRATVGGVAVAARPHAVIETERGVVVVRARVSPRLAASRYDYVYLQAAALAVGLESGLLALAVGSSGGALGEALKALASRPAPARGDGWAVFVWVYERGRALAELAPLLAYWRGERPPRASPSPYRCSSCPFRAECPHAVLYDSPRQPLEESDVDNAGDGHPGQHVEDH